MRKLWSLLLCFAVIAGILAGCSINPSMVDENGNDMIALILREDRDQTALESGAARAAAELGRKAIKITANTETPATQAELIRQAVSSGYHAMVVAADGTQEVSSALQEAVDAGVKVICVGMQPDAEVDAVFMTDHTAAGKTAGGTLLDALAVKGISGGTVGIVNADDTAGPAFQRETGFRKAFEGTAFTVLETRYDEGSAAKAEAITEDCIAQDVVGMFGCSDISAEGIGNAVKAAAVDVVVVGCDSSDAVMTLIEEGYILAAVAENPDGMGYEGVKAAVAALQEETLGGAVTDTGVTVLKAKEATVSAEISGSDCKIALIMKNGFEDQWDALEEGAKKAAEELGCEVSNLSPFMSDDELQAEQIREAVEEGYQAIVIAAEKSDAVSEALKNAYRAGVKLIYVDSPARIRAEISYVTDKRAAGQKAGETMLEELKAREITEGNVSIIGVNTEDHGAVQLETGFREAFEGTAFTSQETRYSEGDMAKAHALARQDIEDGVAGIFAADEGATIGAGNAAEEKKADAVVIGYGNGDAIQDLIEEEYILATVVQNPDTMGYEAVKAACAALGGKNLRGAVTDAGVSLLSEETIEE